MLGTILLVVLCILSASLFSSLQKVAWFSIPTITPLLIYAFHFNGCYCHVLYVFKDI